MPLAGRTGEYRCAAHGGTTVAQERPEPLEHDFAEQMLLGDAVRTVLPAVADQPQSGRHDLLDGGLDIMKRERLLDQGGEAPRVRPADRSDDGIPQSCRRGLGARVVSLEQSCRLPDSEAFREAVAQPLHTRDVSLVVAALAAGRPAGAEDAVAPLPLAERVRPDSGPLRDGSDVEPRAELLRCRAGVKIRGDCRGEILQDARVILGPCPRPRVDRAERADRGSARSAQRHPDVGHDPQRPDRGAVPHERVGPGVLDQQRLLCPDCVLARGV